MLCLIPATFNQYTVQTTIKHRRNFTPETQLKQLPSSCVKEYMFVCKWRAGDLLLPECVPFPACTQRLNVKKKKLYYIQLLDAINIILQDLSEHY